jgi:meiotic recombination protein DMC1
MRSREKKDSASQAVADPAVVEASDDEEEDSVRSFEPIDLLQDAGINATDIAKLKEDGFVTIGQLFQVSQRKLLGVKGISEAKLDKVRKGQEH